MPTRILIFHTGKVHVISFENPQLKIITFTFPFQSATHFGMRILFTGKHGLLSRRISTLSSIGPVLPGFGSGGEYFTNRLAYGERFLTY